MKLLKFINNKVTPSYAVLAIVLMCNLTLPFCALILLAPSVKVSLTTFANIAQVVAALTGILGTIYLVKNFSVQIDINQEEKIDKGFELRCKSIENGLTRLVLPASTVTGATALISLSNLRNGGSMTFSQVTDKLRVESLQVLAAALTEFLIWFSRDPRHLHLYPAFKTQYEVIMQALVKIIPSEHLYLAPEALNEHYNGKPNTIFYVTTMAKLKKLDHDLDIAFLARNAS